MVDVLVTGEENHTVFIFTAKKKFICAHFRLNHALKLQNHACHENLDK